MKDAMDTYKTINVTDAIDLIKTGKVILADIRDRESYMQSHISDAIHLTQDNLEEFKNNSGPDKIIILYCYHGNNSVGAAQYFANLGYQNVYSLDGGFSEYSNHKF